MGIVDSLKRLWSKDSVHYTVAVLPDANVLPAFPSADIEAERHYFRIWLAEMFLKDDRRLFREYVPVVHSAVTLTYGTLTKELPYVAGPHNLNLASELGEGVQLDHRLTNLLPFRGGAVDVATALVAYKEKDFFQGFVSVLNDVSGLLNAGQLGSYLKFAETAVDGIQTLLGAGDKDIHLLFFRGFGGTSPTGGHTLRSGYTAVIKANANKFDKTKLFVNDSRLLYGNTMQTAQPLTGYDYLLLRFERTESRDDAMSFEEFAKLLQTAIREGHQDRARGDSVIKAAEVLVWESTDLTLDDRFRVAKAITDVYLRSFGEANIAKFRETDTLELLVSRIREVDPRHTARAVSHVLKDGTPSLERFRETLLELGAATKEDRR